MARQAFVLADGLGRASPWSKVVKTKSNGLAPEDWKGAGEGKRKPHL
jgi:hypothetical protein